MASVVDMYVSTGETENGAFIGMGRSKGSVSALRGRLGLSETGVTGSTADK